MKHVFIWVNWQIQEQLFFSLFQKGIASLLECQNKPPPKKKRSPLKKSLEYLTAVKQEGKN